MYNTLESFLLGVAVSGIGLADAPNLDSAGQGLLLCLIEHTEGVATVLEREFPRFPKHVLSYIKSGNAFTAGSSLSPGREENSELSFLENHLSIGDATSEDREDLQPGYHLGSAEIRSMPLAVWSGGVLERRSLRIPLVMVIGDFVQTDVALFVTHCRSHCDGGETTRLQRLMMCPEWIYLDLYSAFMDWEGIWDAVRDRLVELDHEVHRQVGRGNILGRIENLNKATAVNIMLRETLDVQTSSLQTVMKLVKQAKGKGSNKQDARFLKRGDELSGALDHCQALAHGNREQLQNLVSMLISLEQISQGQSMARLNFLAFIFLPLSFVATLFGMTRFTISPEWYPAYALPLLFLTFAVAIALPKLLLIWETWNIPQKQKQKPIRRPRLSENLPGKRLWKFNDGSTDSIQKSYPPISMSGAVDEVTERGRSLE
ncbi:hypothetical protein ONS95_013367 [Cadophora gregata]|uniref:uncharacterized protein n=1 Tax=Cadophora gregata TaxID=51156 RepID=UPI0026DD4DFF|nr:uncharacterized protein ONS95_013367 [Cadophora gregata]KAK0099739.1 hypothetical protein ONS96_008236 [Cadophora gregata f. sp. sojae]KAK0116346.1 hypothetical protein ONS95_013367 [Cadophora gregata]